MIVKGGFVHVAFALIKRITINSMNEKELVVIEATAEGIKKARETEVPE